MVLRWRGPLGPARPRSGLRVSWRARLRPSSVAVLSFVLAAARLEAGLACSFCVGAHPPISAVWERTPHLSSVGAHPPISAGVRGPECLCALGFRSASPRLARFSSFRSGPAPLLSEASLLLTFFIYFFNFKHPRHLKGISSFFRSAGASSPCL